MPTTQPEQEAHRIARLPTFNARRTAIRAFLITHPEVDANEFYVTYFVQKDRHDKEEERAHG